MDRPSCASGHESLADAAVDDIRPPPVQTDTRRSSTTEESSQSASETLSCPWRTRQFYYQECSRFFDCPSHTIERRLSIDEHQDSPRDGHELTEDRRTSEDELYSSDTGEDLASGRLRRMNLDVDPEPPSPERVTDQTPNLQPDPTLPEEGEPSTQPTEDARRQERHAPRRIDEAIHQDEPGRLTVSVPRAGAAENTQGQHEEPPVSPVSPLTTFRAASTVSNIQSHAQEVATPEGPPLLSHHRLHQPTNRDSPDFVLPRWQPDAEATYCPICYTQFSIFVRKHHCRKCGRVVCNSCSPHRIIIPHQYIVRPPGSEMPMPQSLLLDSLGSGYFDINGSSGGERVRLCNPCVPDPNTAPPQSSTASTPPATSSAYGVHHRSRSSIGDAYGAAIPPSNRYGVVFPLGPSNDPFRNPPPRSRSSTVHPYNHGHGHAGGSSSARNRGSTGSYYAALDPFAAGGSSQYPHRYSSLRDAGSSSSSRQRTLPPTPQIAEEDECPICHRELPSRTLPSFEALRESHITMCIQSHSTYGSPRRGTDTDQNEPLAAPRRTGMYTYSATEKDCIDDAECTICLEEFTVGVAMARLECLCRFHRSCISAWFVNHPGRCPVHQHDGFGY